MYTYTNLPVNAIARQANSRIGDSQSEETLLAPFNDKQIRYYDTGCSNHPLYPSTLGHTDSITR